MNIFRTSVCVEHQPTLGARPARVRDGLRCWLLALALGGTVACGSNPADSGDSDATVLDAGRDAVAIDARDVLEEDAITDAVQDAEDTQGDATDVPDVPQDVVPDTAVDERTEQCFPLFEEREWSDPLEGFGRRVYVGSVDGDRVAIQQAFNLDLWVFEDVDGTLSQTRTLEGFGQFLIGGSAGSDHWLFLDPAGGEVYWTSLGEDGFVLESSLAVPLNALEGDHAFGDTAVRDTEGTVWLASNPGPGDVELSWQPLDGTYVGIRFAGPTELGNGLLAAWTESGRIDLYQLSPDAMVPVRLWSVESEMRFIDDVAATQREQVVAAVGGGGLQIFSPDSSLLFGFRSSESDYADVARWESPTGKLGFATAADDHTTLWSVGGESVEREWSWVGGGQLFNFDEQSNSGAHVGGSFYSTSHLLEAPGGFHFEPVWQPAGELFEASLDPDGNADLIVSVTSLSDLFGWTGISPSTRPQPLENEYNGMRARYDSCTPIADGWHIGESFVCTGNFLVTLLPEDGRLVWNRRGTEFFEEVVPDESRLPVDSRLPRIASLGNGTAVILVDFTLFDGHGVFPQPASTVRFLTYAVHLDQATEPMLISHADETLGLSSFGPEHGYVRFGEDGAWWMQEVDLEALEFRGPIQVTAEPILEAVPMVVPEEDPRLVALFADGTVGDVSVIPLQWRGEGARHTDLASSANLWGRRDPMGAVAYGFTETEAEGARHGLFAAREPSARAELLAWLPGEPQSTTFGDFDGDGTTDAAVMTRNPDGVVFLFGAECAP